MAGNSIGQLFRVTTAGESHGKALVAIVDGAPAGIEISEAEIQVDLDRRKPGQSRHTTQRRESDRVQILSGIFEGKTTGTSIALLIENEDQRSRDYNDIKDLFRPGHADFTYHHKYHGHRDYRGGGRSSARETAIRVAAGAIAKKVLKTYYNTDIYGYLAQLGPNRPSSFDRHAIEAEGNPFFWPNLEDISTLEQYMDQLRKSGDSVGAKVTVVAENLPIGLGEPVFDRLDAEIAYALMSINAVKGVEIGDGFDAVEALGTQFRDEIDANGFRSNHAGGILGGISTGQPITANIALKPTSSLRLEGDTIDKFGNPTTVITKGRHDPCVGIRAIPIAEAMMAITLLDHALRNQGQLGHPSHQA